MRTYVSTAVVLLLLAVSVLIFESGEALPTRASSPTFSGGAVSPATGYNNTIFNFTVWYMDADGDLPVYVAVFIDDVQYNMTCGIGGTPNVTRLVPYYYSTTLSTGNHTYYFFANNTVNETVRSPVKGSNQLTVGIQQTGPNLSGGKHSPDLPLEGTAVNFTVTYSDPDGNAPSGVYVDYIHGGLDSNYTYGNVTMNVSGINYKTGVLCHALITFEAGTCYYKFSTTNNKSEKARYPSSTYLSVKIAQRITDSKPMISNVNISPAAPVENENFTISAVYSDTDNDMPVSVILNIYDANLTPKYNYTMAVAGSNYIAGVTCSRILRLDDGTYYFDIKAVNRNASVTSNPSILNVTRNNTNPANQLRSGGHYPSNPVHNQTVNFTVTFTDSGNLPPNIIQLAIKASGSFMPYIFYNMSVGSGTNYTKGVVYYKTLKLPAGNYSYYFQATPGNMLTIIFFYPAGATPISLYVRPNGSLKDNPPQLYSSSTSPRNPTSDQAVNFTVYYKDIDGDAPSYLLLVIRSGNSIMNYSMKGIGTGYGRGVVYYKSLKLKSGNHTYYFVTASKNYSARLPGSGSLTLYVSPPVKKDNSPVLYTPGVNPGKPNSSTPINFTIYYKDADNDAPSSMLLYLSASGSRNFTSYNMKKKGTGYTSGVQLYRVLTLSSGNYSYYFQARSTNFTVTYPSSSILTLYVAPVSGGGGDGGDDVTPPDDDDTEPADDDTEPGIDGRVEIKSDNEGGADMDVIEIEEGFTISLIDFGDGKMEVEVRSDTPVKRIVVLGLEDDLFGGASMEDLIIFLDGKEIALADLQDLLDGMGSEPVYHIVYADGSYDLYIYIPETTTHTISAQVREEDDPSSGHGWIWMLLGILVVVVVVVLLAVALLTAAQRKRKTEAYFEDFEIGMKDDDRVIRGDLEDKDWNDIIE
ncbi:MAG: hypothetical protein ACMUIG_07550 [Thermoplasmatota archaeon]